MMHAPHPRLPALLLLAFVIAHGLGQAQTEAPSPMPFYIGTYTGGESEGIYRSTMDPASGRFSEPTLAAKSEHPSFLAIHPDGKHLYAVNETGNFQGAASGAVSAFAIDTDSGSLTLLNQQPSHGSAPCHLVVDPSGRYVLVANYAGGSVASFPIEADGRLGAAASVVQHEGASVNRARQQAPHAHSINLDPGGRFAYAADLGVDKIFVYAFQPETGRLDPLPDRSAVLPPGSGPRHFAFHPDGQRAFVINELTCTVTAFDVDPETGALQTRQSLSTLPGEREEGQSTAEIVVGPKGRHVYGSNRGHDSIVVFKLSAEGELELIENEPTQGKTPRNFVIDPTGRFLLAANQGTHSVVAFQIDPDSGALSPTGEKIQVPNPVCLRFLPAPGD